MSLRQGTTKELAVQRAMAPTMSAGAAGMYRPARRGELAPTLTICKRTVNSP